MTWPFSDPPNAAVFTSKKILENKHWIHYVTHDEDDGAWQFHPLCGAMEGEAAVASLKTITELDASIMSLWDLPVGWQAFRKSMNSEWIRGRKQ